MLSGWDGAASRRLSRVDVFEQLRTRLVNGEWHPGQVVQEQVLAVELNVSKTPVREALQLLALQGMVRPVNRVGYVVSPIDLSDVVEVFQYRVLLETDLTAQLASLPSAKLEVVRKDEESPVLNHETVCSEMAFHRMLYESLSQPRRQANLSVLVDQTARAIVYVGLAQSLLNLLEDEHKQIYHAVAARDSELARSLMAVHLSHLRDSVLAKLRQQLREQENLL